MLVRADLTPAVEQLLGRSGLEVLTWSVAPTAPSTGRATGAVEHVRGTAMDHDRGDVLPWAMVAKSLRPRAGSGPDDDPTHWTYWKRELLAYQSRLLPNGEHGLGRVACLAVVPTDDAGMTILLAEAPGTPAAQWSMDSFAGAARSLGRWQAAWLGTVPPAPWLVADQLRQRISRTDASGGLGEPGLSRPLMAVWDQRWRMVDGMASCPSTLVHGDFSAGNLTESRDGEVVVLDWATLGHGPLGFDLAHLVLSASAQLWPHTDVAAIDNRLSGAYLEGLGAVELGAAVRFVSAATVALVGVSRLCWTLRRTNDASVLDYWSDIAAWIVAQEREAHT